MLHRLLRLWARRGRPAPFPPARRRLIVFTRFPEPGRAKTRLIPRLGSDGAAALQREMTEHTMKTARRYGERTGAALEVRFAGGGRGEMEAWLGGGDAIFRPQEGSDLGERMRCAIGDALAEGAERVVVIGTDCPALNERILAGAFRALGRRGGGGAPVVLGPAHDGGYYLIGMSRLVAAAFEGIAWGTDRVMDETLTRLKAVGIQPALLPALHDVDRPEDYPHWLAARAERAERAEREKSIPRPALSVIIPTLNEAARIGGAIGALMGEPGIEIIVVDGGSADGTAARAREHGARVIETRLANRARQMNAGAMRARSETLLFLHADTRPPRGFARMVQAALGRPGVVAGAFPLRFDEGGAGLRLLAATANARSRLWQMPYGDQGIFLRRRTFAAIGGFRALPVMEDYDLMLRLRRLGRIVLAPTPAVTSGRRYRERGLLRTWLTHQLMALGWRAGFPPATLARWRR